MTPPRTYGIISDIEVAFTSYFLLISPLFSLDTNSIGIPLQYLLLRLCHSCHRSALSTLDQTERDNYADKEPYHSSYGSLSCGGRSTSGREMGESK